MGHTSTAYQAMDKKISIENTKQPSERNLVAILFEDCQKPMVVNLMNQSFLYSHNIWFPKLYLGKPLM